MQRTFDPEPGESDAVTKTTRLQTSPLGVEGQRSTLPVY